MKLRFWFLGLLMIFSLSSCVEILDDISFNLDGSGTLKYNINLSASKVKINSILALDSLNGQKVPTIEEIEKEIQRFSQAFSKKQGVSNVVIESDFENFLFKLQCDFENVDLLQKAILETVKEEMKGDNSVINSQIKWLKLTPELLQRSIPEFNTDKIKNLKQEDLDLLQKGTYISITRFQKPVKEFSNPKAILSKNKTAVMLRANTYEVSQNPEILENTIYLSPSKP
ncbi:MAG: hypothetical protein N4A41_04630 [Crocinitomicaceae bacterium]|jgi:hypothetical protein|nr:hypothetical protein [Crocinitomicaceae bacterium]